MSLSFDSGEMFPYVLPILDAYIMSLFDSGEILPYVLPKQDAYIASFDS